MSWGIEFEAGLFIQGIYKENVESALEDCKDSIARCESELLVLAASTPRVVEIDDEKWEWMEYIIMRSNNIYTELSELYFRKVKLEIALENTDKIKNV